MKTKIIREGAIGNHYNVYAYPKGRPRFVGTIIRKPKEFVAQVEGKIHGFSCPHKAEQYILENANLD